jgi:ATP-dependent Clp protease adaptor protein ClpS
MIQQNTDHSRPKEHIVMSEETGSVVDEPIEKTVKRKKEEQKNKPRKQPRYNVILWDDDDHSYDYVIRLMKEVFGHQIERGYELAVEVDTSGKAICLTTTMEHAELKRDQIHAYGKDDLIARCKGSMSASIEPIE